MKKEDGVLKIILFGCILALVSIAFASVCSGVIGPFGKELVFENNVRIFVYYEGTSQFGWGSGFVVQDQQDNFYVLTAAHVVLEEEKKIQEILGRFQFKKGNAWYYVDNNLESVFIDEEHDFALLKLQPQEERGYHTYVDGQLIETTKQLAPLLSKRNSYLGNSDNLILREEVLFFSADANFALNGTLKDLTGTTLRFEAGNANGSEESKQVIFERDKSIIPGDSGSAVVIENHENLEIVGLLQVVDLRLVEKQEGQAVVLGVATKINVIRDIVTKETGLVLR